MKKNLDFTYVTSGLEVSFRVLTKVPAKSIFDWALAMIRERFSMVEDINLTLMRSLDFMM